MSIASEKTSPPDDVHAKQEHGVLQSLERFFARGWVRSLVVSLVLFALLLIPRLADLDALVTPDEPLWIARSANFYEAITGGDLRGTYQYVHPGVPVMWLGAFGYFLHIRDLPDLMGGQVNVRNRDFQDVLQANGYSILDALVELRQIVIIASALVVIALFLCLTRITDFWAAAAAIAFLAFDPLHIGFTRLLHLDGLSANLVLAAVVAFSWYLQRNSSWALIVAGILTGVACLTRAVNAIAGPFFVLLALSEVLLVWRGNRKSAIALARKYVTGIAIVGLITCLTFFVLWPAMWVSAIGTLKDIWNGSRDLTGEGGGRDIYFRDDVVSNPGWLYYPVVVAYRMSPFTAVGLAVAVCAALRPADVGARFNRRLAAHLISFALVYLVIITLSEKKLDRYVLPSIVALDLVAGLALASAAIWLGKSLFSVNASAARVTAALLVGIVLLGQTDYAMRYRPFYLDAATPFLGGVAGAQDEFSFNWGEGGKEVAEALLTIPGIEGTRVSGGLWAKTIDYYLPFEIAQPVYDMNLETAADWVATDYVVLVFPEIQRQVYPLSLLDWFSQQTPIATVATIDGIYAQIYDIRAVAPPDAFYASEPKAVWSGIGAVLAIDSARVRSTGANAFVFSLYIQPTVEAVDVVVRGEVVAADGSIVGSSSTNTSLTPGLEGLAVVNVRIPVPPDLPKGHYELRYSIENPATGKPFAATNAIDGSILGDTVTIGDVYLRPTPPIDATN